ncbi:hypothetical protein L596_023105 [Steinernema carpocapsae]|uniref:BTB domain-containing protein n=1 Tax=Steinernema carpocapsae TaxID=34508 RepID=A0A4U5MDG3_STECR|nr:hypothetical protein L596_023105 [Steinernema carpocapsae]
MSKNRAHFVFEFEVDSVPEEKGDDEEDDEFETECQNISGLDFCLCVSRLGEEIRVYMFCYDSDIYLSWHQSVIQLEATLDGAAHYKGRRERTRNACTDEMYSLGKVKTGHMVLKCDYEITRINSFKIDEFEEGLADVFMAIGDQKLFVSRLFLTAHSPVFAAMLNSDSFIEGKEQKCHLQDTSYHDFFYLLHRFYGLPLVYQDIKEYVKGILKLAHRFQFQAVISEIEDYLLTLDNSETQKWLELADAFQLTRLASKIISNMDGNQLKTIYKDALQGGHKAVTKAFAPATIDVMFARIMDLMPDPK